MAMVRPQVRHEDHSKQNDGDELLDIFIYGVKDSNGDTQRRKNPKNITKSVMSLPDSEWNGSLNKMKVNEKELVKISNPPHGQKSLERFKHDKAMDNSDITKKTELNPRSSTKRMLADEVHKKVGQRKVFVLHFLQPANEIAH